MKKTIFSGIQPTATAPHLGNYLGALKQWVELQDDYQAIYCVVDLHALTIPQDPKILKEATFSAYALLLAIGINPKKSTLFVQSHNRYHSELTWLLNCFAHPGELDRMTQYKEKSSAQKQNSTVGLYDYPVLMAADILLYDTQVVPVGEDQIQHVELTRNLAERFNNRYGETFQMPMAKIVKETKRIMSLQDPTKKMSKSDVNQNGTLFLLDSPEVLVKKIRCAVTDSETNIIFDEKRPGLFNLLNIYKALTQKEEHEIEERFLHSSYKQMKEELSELLVELFKPIRQKYLEFSKDKVVLEKLMKENALKSEALAEKKVREVKEKIGMIV